MFFTQNCKEINFIAQKVLAPSLGFPLMRVIIMNSNREQESRFDLLLIIFKLYMHTIFQIFKLILQFLKVQIYKYKSLNKQDNRIKLNNFLTFSNQFNIVLSNFYTFRDDQKDELLEGLKQLWEHFISNVTSVATLDYLNIQHLGLILKNLSKNGN